MRQSGGRQGDLLPTQAAGFGAELQGVDHVHARDRADDQLFGKTLIDAGDLLGESQVVKEPVPLRNVILLSSPEHEASDDNSVHVTVRADGGARLEAELKAMTGATKVIWLPGDPDETETDGHVDGIAAFVRPGVVLIEDPGPPGGPFLLVRLSPCGPCASSCSSSRRPGPVRGSCSPPTTRSRAPWWLPSAAPRPM